MPKAPPKKMNHRHTVNPYGGGGGGPRPAGQGSMYGQALAGAPASQARPRTSFRPSMVWSADDDQRLKDARARSGNWAQIAATHFPSKTPNACRKRHERLMERQSTDAWDGVKLETLAVEYGRIREPMWRMLGDVLGEKWQVIEAKCMEKGVKTLGAVQRNAERHGTSHGEASAISDDSGVGLDDAEYMLVGNHGQRQGHAGMDLRALHAGQNMNMPSSLAAPHHSRTAYLPLTSIM